MSKEYYVYIMTNKSRTLYTGVMNDLMRRVYEHKNKLVKGFTSRYNIQYLVYYESTSSIHVALEREKQIKGWLRKKKIVLIEANYQGQLGMLLRQQCGIDIKDKILKYDGRPFYFDELQNLILQNL